MYPATSEINKGALSLMPLGSGDSFGMGFYPLVFTTPQEEMLACRKGAWLGVALTISPTYDLTGPDVVKLLNHASINRDYAKLKVGRSRLVIMCNDQGQVITEGVLLRTSEENYRSYWLYPFLGYYVSTMGLDVTATPVLDEYTFQLDGPTSLQIVERAAKRDLHDLRFGGNTQIEIAGTPVLIYRLGMSGALAYEMHGKLADADVVYGALLEAGKDLGIVRQGYNQYNLNHTQAGYPNTAIHYWYPFITSGDEIKNYIVNDPTCPPYWKVNLIAGSAADDVENGFATPYELGLDYLIKWDHDFVGRTALEAMRDQPHRSLTTLEWNLEDVGKVFSAQVADPAMLPFDDIANNGDAGKFPIIMSKVLDGERMVGVASGRIRDFYHSTMISLARIDPELAEEGTELTVVWGSNPATQRRIRAKVARFPYYQGDWRNETCDVNTMVPRYQG